ncbi:MAG: T9SS type A sorting domain-containing protein, partial [bacterium]|nr:T9SS type A sorting domain-containing protein [bacterium]
FHSAQAVAVAGNFAFVANRSSGLRVIDVSNPSLPIEVGYYDTPGDARDVAVVGNYAYVADGTASLRVIDISSPTQPAEIGYCETICYVRAVAGAGDYAYVIGDDAGLHVINVSNPANPVLVGDYDTPGYAMSVAVAGNYIYVADHGAGLRVINVSNPANPVLVGYYDTQGYAYGVAAMGNYAYVADSYDLSIYDCSAALGTSDSFTPHPSTFILSAYPNPFNAATQIQFEVPRHSFVQLHVYDLQGRLVETLASRMFDAGTHQVALDASNRASGMYIVQMKSGDFSAAQKLILLK